MLIDRAKHINFGSMYELSKFRTLSRIKFPDFFYNVDIDNINNINNNHNNNNMKNNTNNINNNNTISKKCISPSKVIILTIR